MTSAVVRKRTRPRVSERQLLLAHLRKHRTHWIDTIAMLYRVLEKQGGYQHRYLKRQAIVAAQQSAKEVDELIEELELG